MNKKLLLVLIGLIFISIFFILNQKAINLIVRTIFEWRFLNITLWCYILICFIINYLSLNDVTNNESGMIFKEFGFFANSAFTAITFGLALTTSTSILKGIYIQQYFRDKIYFNEFSEIDIYSLLVVSLFLFGYSIISSFRVLKRAIVLKNSNEIEMR